MGMNIKNKYLYVAEDGKQVAYFENFESRGIKRKVIQITSEDNRGEKFISRNNYLITDCDVYWFSSKKTKYRVMFVKDKGAFNYLILIEPKLLKLNK